MKPVLRKIRRGLLYFSFFLTAFIVFFYVTFPYNRLKTEAERRAREAGIALTIADLGPALGLGVSATGVRIDFDPPEDHEGPVPSFEVSELTATIAPLSLLTGAIGVNFDGQMPSGSLEGFVEQSGDSQAVTAHVEGLDLRRVPAVSLAMGPPIRGFVGLDIDLNLPEAVEESSGHVHISIESLKVGDGEAQVRIPGIGGLTIPETQAGDLALEVEVSEGTAEITRFRSTGPDLLVAGTGDVRFARPLVASRLNLLLRAEFAESYRESNPRIRAMFGLLQNNPMGRNARAGEGAVQFRLRGSVASRIRPTPAGRERMPGAN